MRGVRVRASSDARAWTVRQLAESPVGRDCSASYEAKRVKSVSVPLDTSRQPARLHTRSTHGCYLHDSRCVRIARPTHGAATRARAADRARSWRRRNDRSGVRDRVEVARGSRSDRVGRSHRRDLAHAGTAPARGGGAWAVAGRGRRSARVGGRARVLG